INATPSACAPAFLPGRHIGVSAMNAFRNEYGFLPLRHIVFRGFDLPFGAMHSGCTLLARPLEVLICLSVPCTSVVSFDRWSANRYIMPFDAMYAASSLLTRSQQRANFQDFTLDYYFAINGLKVKFELAATGAPE
ncbi:hypothetical protein Tco_1472221, partial [Tanacetum coccineum]